MITSYLQRKKNNIINYIILLFKKDNEIMLFFNFNLIGKRLFIF